MKWPVEYIGALQHSDECGPEVVANMRRCKPDACKDAKMLQLIQQWDGAHLAKAGRNISVCFITYNNIF